jgi:hypothetical protein
MTQETASAGPLARLLFTVLGVVSIVLGVLSTGWLVLMIHQWAMPWSSLAITMPPGAHMPGPPAPGGH